MIAAAQRLAAHGLAVFPVSPDCRKPWSAHGYKDATKDPDKIEAMWRLRPEARIAVACGAVSGVFVLDVDVKGANGLRTLAELEAAHGPLPAHTWSVSTPSGGRHRYFRQPARSIRNRVCFAPGLDVRTDGGSVAVPPSRRHDGAYAWEVAPWDGPLADAPDWLLTLIDPPPAIRPPRPPLRFRSPDGAARYAEAVVNGECREVARMGPASGRNHRLFRAGINLGSLVGAGMLCEADAESYLESAARDCGLVAEDGRRAALATIASGLKRGIAQPREVRL